MLFQGLGTLCESFCVVPTANSAQLLAGLLQAHQHVKLAQALPAGKLRSVPWQPGTLPHLQDLLHTRLLVFFPGHTRQDDTIYFKEEPSYCPYMPRKPCRVPVRCLSQPQTVRERCDRRRGTSEPPRASRNSGVGCTRVSATPRSHRSDVPLQAHFGVWMNYQVQHFTHEPPGDPTRMSEFPQAIFGSERWHIDRKSLCSWCPNPPLDDPSHGAPFLHAALQLGRHGMTFEQSLERAHVRTATGG